MAAPRDLASPLRGALFEEDAVEKGRNRLLDEARRRGHLRATVETEVGKSDNERTVVSQVDPGPLVTITDVQFPGAEALSRSRLLAAAGGPSALLVSPKQAH